MTSMGVMSSTSASAGDLSAIDKQLPKSRCKASPWWWVMVMVSVMGLEIIDGHFWLRLQFEEGIVTYPFRVFRIHARSNNYQNFVRVRKVGWFFGGEFRIKFA
jgi:hypothetical protein